MVKTLLLFLLVCGLCAISGTTLGQMYKWVDEKGTVHFSDDPSLFNRSKENQTSKENAIETIKRSERQKLLNFKPNYMLRRSESEIYEEEMSKAIKQADEQNEELLGRTKDLNDSQKKSGKLTKDERRERRLERELQQKMNPQPKQDKLPREWEVNPVPGGAWDNKGNFYTKTPGGYFDPKSGQWLPK
jgi:hypothetical protein